jgi:predicted nucleic acid-binding protein
MGQVAGFRELPLTAETSRIASRLQDALWHGGLVRAAGVFDTLTAAVTLQHAATVLHYDRDFEHLAAVCPEFSQEWAVPSPHDTSY